MNPFVSRITGNSWIVPVSILSLVLGFMMMMALVTESTRASRLPLLSADQSQRLNTPTFDKLDEYKKLADEAAKLREEVSKVRDEKTKLENAVASQTSSTKVLNDSLQEAKMVAGLTEVEGPGVTVKLRDSTKRVQQGFEADNVNIHDLDVLRVVNELWSSGAEAISVNRHRIVGRSSIRCVGPVIHVDGVPISPPVVIMALGDPDTLVGGLNIRLGVIEELRSIDPNMVAISTFEKARLPAFTGSTSYRFGTVPKEKK